MLYNGARGNGKISKKEKEILFVGRLVAEKGVDLYVEVIKSITQISRLEIYPIGSLRLGYDNNEGSFASKIITKFKVGNQTT